MLHCLIHPGGGKDALALVLVYRILFCCLAHGAAESGSVKSSTAYFLFILFAEFIVSWGRTIVSGRLGLFMRRGIFSLRGLAGEWQRPRQGAACDI